MVRLLAVLLALWPLAAQAEFRVCNDSGVSRSLAVAYGSDGAWISEGWWVIAPGDCATAISGPLKQRYIYWRATAAGQDFAHDGYMFCTTAEPFTIEGDENCAERGFETAGFRMADTGTTEPDFTLVLNDATLTQAPAPGLAGPIPAAGPGFQPGTLGEPFTQTALLQSCGPTELGPACMFYAEGWRYLAARNTVTPAEIFAVLEGLPVNTPVVITGEITSQGDITAEVNLSRIEPGPPDPWAEIRAALQGDWVSLDDPQSRMRIEGSEMTDLYGDETLGVSVATLGPACADGTEVQTVALNLAMMGMMDEPPICWAINEATPDSLQVTYMGRGNTLSFRRP